MPDFFYLTIICVVFISMIIHEIYLFNKGKYYPYLYGHKGVREKVISIVCIIVLWFCFRNLPPKVVPSFIILFLLIATCLCVSLLNYLSYVKTKDRKIIYHTLILDISVIALILFMELI